MVSQPGLPVLAVLVSVVLLHDDINTSSDVFGALVYAYGSKDCTGSRASLGSDSDDSCHNIANKGSVMVDNCH